MTLPSAEEPRTVVAICGGAVAGSEAAALCAERGALAIVFEQNPRPYGKIEDGLPRWHSKLRHKEYRKIDENLQKPGVVFVPCTRLGGEISFRTLSGELGFSAVLLAHGAWRDRPLQVEGVDRFIDRGLVYQNAFVHWYNHYPEASYDGPRYEVPDGTIVVGGGLASIDVVKIIMLELYGRALGERGVDVDQEEMEVKGIEAYCKAHGVEAPSLGIEGCTLYYRRRKQDMPLAGMDNPTPEQARKLEAARAKIMDRVVRKYLVRFEERNLPVAPIVEDDRLCGLRFVRTEIVDRKVIPQPGTEHDVRSDLVISSIGSVPIPIDGVPMKGELYAWKDWDTGELADRVFGLGNVLTGKGNIKVSRQNARDISSEVVDKALAAPKVPPEVLRGIMDVVRARWEAVGYPGDYRAWMEGACPADMRGSSKRTASVVK